MTHPRDSDGTLRVSRSRDEVRRYYDRIARFYDLMAEASEGPVRREGLALLRAQPGERVIELGCGTGRALASLSRAVLPNGRVVGVDLSDGMLARARAHLEGTAGESVVELVSADATELPFEPASYDAAFASFALELFDGPEIPRVLAELSRVLRPGGRVVIVGMSREDPREPWVRLFEWAHVHAPWLLDCRPVRVRRLLEDAGFAVEKVLARRAFVPVEVVLARRR